MSDLSDTEKKLTNIWKVVFCLSEADWQNLARQSDFSDCIKSFCKKLNFSVDNSSAVNFVVGVVRENLISSVNSEFGIWSDGIADQQTLGEQAVYIDCCLTIKSCDDRPVKMQYKLDKLELPSGMSFLPIIDVDNRESAT